MVGDFTSLSYLTYVGLAYLTGLEGLFIGQKWQPASQRYPAPFLILLVPGRNLLLRSSIFLRILLIPDFI